MPIYLEEMLLEVINLDMERMQAMALPLSLLPTWPCIDGLRNGYWVMCGTKQILGRAVEWLSTSA
jgi:hypothetical protein